MRIILRVLVHTAYAELSSVSCGCHWGLIVVRVTLVFGCGGGIAGVVLVGVIVVSVTACFLSLFLRDLCRCVVCVVCVYDAWLGRGASVFS